jgi:replication initiation and membrane attachment protein
MLVKQIDTFEKAVQYVREQAQVEQEKERRKEAAASFGGAGGGAYNGAKGNGRSGGNSRGTPRKPSIPIVEEGQPASAVSADELEELRKLARKLDGK